MKKYILLFLLLGGAVALASAQNAIKGKIKGYIGEKITVSYYKGKKRQTDTVAVAKNGNFTYESAECVADALTVGQQQLLLFMRPGSQLEINLDIRDAENSREITRLRMIISSFSNSSNNCRINYLQENTSLLKNFRRGFSLLSIRLLTNWKKYRIKN